jgi:DDE family transposase
MLKGLQRLRLSFTEPFLTHYGGLILIQRFCRQLRLRRRLQRSVKLAQGHRSYPAADLFLALMYAIVAGLRRLNQTDILQYNGTFLSLLGLKQFPNQSTWRRFLKRLPTAAIRQLVRLHDQLRQQLLVLPQARTSLTFDLDTVIVTIYGHQQGARLGYNPKKRGRRSYHPLLCFEAHLPEFWHGSLRPGDAGVSTGIIFFVRCCLSKVPQKMARARIRFRADAGFYGGRLITYLEQVGCGYAVVARMHPPLQTLAQQCRFQKMGQGWEAGAFFYQPRRWKSPHRFVVVRRPIPLDPVEARQLTLFKDQKYAYHVLVTNLNTHPWRVWRFYDQRANIEKNIRELLYDYPLARIPTDSWTANVAFFQILLFAFNRVHWFKRLCLPPEYLHATLDTVRSDFLVLPARLYRKDNRNSLVLPRDYHYKREFQTALKKVASLHLEENS